MRKRLTVASVAVSILAATSLVSPAWGAPRPIAQAIVVFEAPDAPPDPAPVMGEYPAEDYEDAAAALPDALVDALAEQGQTGEEYLAKADAAAAAADVVPALDVTIDVLGARLDGSTLVVTVPTQLQVPIVEAAGAVAEVGPAAAVDLAVSTPQFAQELAGGDAFSFQVSVGVSSRCSIGFNGLRVADGDSRFATAGHCSSGNNDYYSWLEQEYAGGPFTQYANARIGRPILGSFGLGGGYDFGLVDVDSTQPRTWEPAPAIRYWGGEMGQPPGQATAITDRIPAVVGATICKSGSTTGWTCGQVLAVDEPVDVQGAIVNSIVTTVCVSSGDSGGGGVIGSAAVGIVSWTESDVPCGHELYTSGMFPLVSIDPVAPTGATSAPDLEPIVSVGNVIFGSPTDGGVAAATITGVLGASGARHSVDLYFDGSATPVRVAVAADGSWTASATGLSPGVHTVRGQGVWGAWSRGPISAPISFTVTGGTISGNVDDHVGANLAGVCVDAWSGGSLYGSSVSAANGNYSVTGAPVGVTTLHFRDCVNDSRTFEDEWWDDADNAATAAPIPVGFAESVTGRDAALALAGPFADVRNNHAFAPQINWMYTEGLSNGYLDAGVRTYHPVEDVSRQAMAAFLYRYSGSPAFDLPDEPTFDDVPADHPFHTEIEWMKVAGITNGNVGPNGTLLYLPSEPVSRQAMSAFLYRLAGSPEFTPPGTPSFTDVPAHHSFATQVEWMKANAVTNGYDDGGSFSYHPAESVSRQAMAAFLSRYDGIE